MDYETWQQRRKEWMEVEKKERSINWQQARGDIQKAITEQAVRELFNRVEALEVKVQKGARWKPKPKAKEAAPVVESFPEPVPVEEDRVDLGVLELLRLAQSHIQAALNDWPNADDSLQAAIKELTRALNWPKAKR